MKNSKFIILGDMHIGARGASPIVMEHQISYFEKNFFPYLKEHNIKTILQMGDLFDTRKFTNHLILYNWKVRFFKYLEEEEIEFITLLGNHDVAFKNTNEVNASTLFLSSYKNVRIIGEPTEYPIDDKIPFLLLPWICESNREEIENALKTTTATYCAGHLEFAGFEINPGMVATEGEDVELFEDFDTVFSGHFHCKSRQGNIQYVGIPYELTWIDYNDPKGFFVFDTTTRKTEFVQNHNYFFTKLEYNDLDGDEDYYKTIDLSGVPKSYVKLIVINKTDANQFDKFIERINKLEPIELKIMDVLESFDDIEIEAEVTVEGTNALIEKFVEQIDTTLDKNKISTQLKTLYVEALNII